MSKVKGHNGDLDFAKGSVPIVQQDNVNHPSHYQSGGLETIDVIKAFTKDCNAYEGFLVGNILKYICRFKKKNRTEDLKKARWYLDELIKECEGSYDEA